MTTNKINITELIKNGDNSRNKDAYNYFLKTNTNNRLTIKKQIPGYEITDDWIINSEEDLIRCLTRTGIDYYIED